MTATANFLAIDLGASAGRVMLGRWDGAAPKPFTLEEMHRFTNGPVELMGRLHWDHLRLWAEIKTGLSRYAATHSEPLAGIGVDTWGVDYALLDRSGRLLGNPYHYRDPGTQGMLKAAFARVPRPQIYETTGIQFMEINTVYQILNRVLTGDPQLEAATDLLFTPDLFHYWLTGRKAVEYTIASSSQMLDARSRTWATSLMDALGIPTHFLGALIDPGTLLGELLPALQTETGLGAVPVIATGTHDTADAVAAVPDLDPRSAYISSGTWSLVGMESPEPVINEQALQLDFTNEGGVANTIRLLKNVAGLWLVQECRRQWQREGRDYGWDDLIQLAGQAEPLRSLVNPDVAAFGSPGDMPAAIRAYCRRTGQPEPETPGAVIRCCLESLALKYRWVVDSLESLTGNRLQAIRIVGGGTQNRLLNQFTADACGRQVVTGPIEATALGNVMIQAIATGHLSDLASGRAAIAASTDRHNYEPRDPVVWQDAYGRFLTLPL